jgi:hypothetical protein
MMKAQLARCVLAVGIAFGIVTSLGVMQARQATDVQIDPNDIGGVVQGRQGPEAGVWVIAETADLPTGFTRIVVTDDEGRFVLPEMPDASYSIWVRGYGLVDSDPITARPGHVVTLTATPAPDARAAASIYPASYWFSLVEPPPASDFPGTGPSGNGISPALQSQADWVHVMKQGCNFCHQVGTKITRELPQNLGPFDSLVHAWDRRVQSGQRGASMSNTMSQFGRARGLEMFADWTDRLMAGETPPAPPRPQGLEQNLVVTLWDWGTEQGYVHDEISSDRRNPTINAHGPVYGVDVSNDLITVVDPRTHTASQIKLASRDTGVRSMFGTEINAPSPYYGDDLTWTNPVNPHTNMMDHLGRVWNAQQIREAEAQPAFCAEGSEHPSASAFPLTRGSRQLAVYDPMTQDTTLIDTCFGTHHLVFAENDNHTLWFSGGRDVIGWFHTKVFEETGDAAAAQGWCPLVLDTNGDGTIGDYLEPESRAREAESTGAYFPPNVRTVNPALDTRINGGAYGVVYSPVDGSIWISSQGVPGKIVRLDPGANPPTTCRAEIYEPPYKNPNVPETQWGFGPRGIDIDRHGVVWTALAASGHMASFDRRKCTVLNGPTATGQHCPEGWTLVPTPGPQLKGVQLAGSANFHYYNWVDQWNTLGLGENIPIAAGSNSDSLQALMPDGTWVVLRVAYPQGFHTRGLDGRIDDPAGGWKGRGVWATYAAGATWHIEGGKGVRPKLVKFQFRPDPLAH